MKQREGYSGVWFPPYSRQNQAAILEASSQAPTGSAESDIPAKLSVTIVPIFATLLATNLREA